jgi:hypothetical protein
MGLDCYIVHANNRDEPFTYKDDERLKDINLCGGILSGGGSDGSFRGKVYEPLLDELMNTMGIWHKDEDDDYIVSADELKEQADTLADFIVAITEEHGDLDDHDTVYITHDGWAEYSYKEVKDLETLLRAAAESKAVMHVWW